MEGSMSISDEYYSRYYKSVTNEGAIGIVSKLVHYSLENWPYSISTHKQNKPNLLRENYKVLEVGAGHGQHVKYVKKFFTSYTQTDFRPDLIEASNIDNVITSRESVNAESLPYENDSFERVIATCLLIHLKEPEEAVKEWIRVLKPGGSITAYIPNEPGLLLRFLQSISTRRKQKKLGIPAKYLHYKEHPYSYPYLVTILRQNSKQVHFRKFPFIFGPWDLNIWTVVTIIKE
jgi:ubiquinone/menaquinone biosynthesis C-methylase UbiE